MKIKHLQKIHDLKSYRNACRVVQQLRPYIHEAFHNREKIIYLNKAGRELIGATKEVKKTSGIDHDLLRNEVYLHFGCPMDWENEFITEVEIEVVPTLEMKINGVKPATKRKIVSDAAFIRNGYIHLIEVDNTRDMSDNKKKIQRYEEIISSINNAVPVLLFFTTTEDRKRKLESWCRGKGFRYQIKTFMELS